MPCILSWVHGSPSTVTTTYDPEPTEQWISQVGCTGSEQTLLMCPSNGWRRDLHVRLCGPTKSAAVECYDNGKSLTRIQSDLVYPDTLEVFRMSSDCETYGLLNNFIW